MKAETLKGVCEALLDTEMVLGVGFSNEFVKEVLDYCIRKLKYIGKDEDYLPILFRCELPMQVVAKNINGRTEELFKKRKEEAGDVFRMYEDALSSSVS